ncbi:MAG: hypothetical protein ACK4FM_01275 [Caldimicrobium sp.]
MKTLRAILGVALVVGIFILFGCASSITGRAGGEKGIAYYLPKPYLLITKNLNLPTEKITEKITEKKEDKGNTTTIERTIESVSTNNTQGDTYSFQVIYLPDLTQKHFLEILPGTGEVKTNITLVDGWKFVGLNLQADAKTADIIKAIGEVIKAAPIPPKPSVKGFFKEEPEIEKAPQKGKAAIWLYEIKVDNGTLKYEQVLHWESD